jgi:hypothetical protein
MKTVDMFVNSSTIYGKLANVVVFCPAATDFNGCT